jgi:hypothetical protein
MDKNGNYKVVYGLKLDQIPKGDNSFRINSKLPSVVMITWRLYPTNGSVMRPCLMLRNYKVVYGLKLDQIPKGDLKVIINGHGELGKINNRGVDEIAQYISTIERATGEDSSIRKVSLIPCDLGSHLNPMFYS